MNNKLIASLLALFIGQFGCHWFYLNNIEKGKKYFWATIIGLLTSWLIIGIFVLLIVDIMCLVDAYNLMTTKNEDFNEKYAVN